MFLSYFDSVIKSIADYTELADNTPWFIRRKLEAVPATLLSNPDVKTAVEELTDFTNALDTKCAFLRILSNDVLKILEKSYIPEIDSFCINQKNLLRIKELCNSTARIICREQKQILPCFELGYDCLEIALSVEKCLDAEARLCTSLSQLFMIIEKIKLTEDRALCFQCENNHFIRTRQLLTGKQQLAAELANRKTANERIDGLAKTEKNDLGKVLSPTKYRASGFSVKESGEFTFYHKYEENNLTDEELEKLINRHKHPFINCMRTAKYSLEETEAFSGQQSTVQSVKYSVRIQHTAPKKSPIPKVYESVPKTDEVRFSAVAPASVKPGKRLPIDIFMYTDAYRSIVDAALQEISGKSIEKTSGYSIAALKSKIRVVLSCDEIDDIEDSELELEWAGKYLTFGFSVKVPKSFDEDELNFCAKVYTNSIIATKLYFTVSAKAADIQTPHLIRTDIKSAFLSYASQDRYRVASILQGIKIARPDLDVFFDIQSIRSGDKWEETLRHEVINRDVLLLFWSEYAKESEWVDMEWHCALENKGVEAIEPVPLIFPELCPPPKELNTMHFNNEMNYIIEALKFTPSFKGPRIVIKKTGEVRSIDVPEVMIGNDHQTAHIVVDDEGLLNGIFSTIIQNDGEYYIKKNSDEVSIKVNEQYITSEDLTKLENGAELNIAGKEMMFYKNSLPAKSTKTA